MTENERDNVITVRLTEDEREMAKFLADADGISISDVVRMQLRRAARERGYRQKVTYVTDAKKLKKK
jgi:antitoxin component of RelBE/YafQ-DinJ toxin-antitoxin module